MKGGESMELEKRIEELEKNCKQEKNAIEVQVQQHEKRLTIIIIVVLLLTVNVIVLSSKLNILINILDDAIQKFVSINQVL